jgi:hypothetical protein
VHDGFGLRWQSAAATALFARQLRGRVFQSGVALRLPPQSKVAPRSNALLLVSYFLLFDWKFFWTLKIQRNINSQTPRSSSKPERFKPRHQFEAMISQVVVFQCPEAANSNCYAVETTNQMVRLIGCLRHSSSVRSGRFNFATVANSTESFRLNHARKSDIKDYE